MVATSTGHRVPHIIHWGVNPGTDHMMAEARDVLPGIGGKVGGKVSGLTAQAVVQARRAMAPHQKQLAQSIMGDLFKLMDDEAAKAVGPFLQSLVDSPDTPDSLRPAL